VSPTVESAGTASGGVSTGTDGGAATATAGAASDDARIEAACRSINRRWIPQLCASISRKRRRMSIGPHGFFAASGATATGRISITSHRPFITSE